MKDPYSSGELIKHGTLCGLAIAYAIPFAAVAVVVGITGIGIPLSLGLMYVGTMPFRSLVRKRIAQEVQWNNKPTEGEKPWFE